MGPQDLAAFQGWLRRRYQTTDQLNEAWGSVFWSMEVGSFSEVSLPNLTRHRGQPGGAHGLLALPVRPGRRLRQDAVRHHPRAFAGALRHAQFHGLLQRVRPLEAGRQPRPRLMGQLPAGLRRGLSLHRKERVRWAETSHPDIAPFTTISIAAWGEGASGSWSSSPAR